MTSAPLAFLATDAPVRRRVVEQLAPAELADTAVVYGLRRLLAADPDVAVRALAAGALGSVRTASPDPVPWLVAALADRSPVVRDAAIRALARHTAGAAYPRLCELAATDTTWWVRRAALYALGVIGASTTGLDPIAPARRALTDPFWRVRHAAIQVLTVCGNRAPERRAEILADIEGGTAQYLSALWGPTLVDDGAAPDPVVSRLPAELLDRDPAVVTARLAAMASPPPLALVELLCDPHVPLRTLAAARLLEAGDPAAFAAALNWLDEPRIPHVAATVTALLDSLGDTALDLATRVLSAPARRGASRWAIGWVVATRYLDLAPAAWARAVELGERTLAMPLAPVEALIDALIDTRIDALGGTDDVALGSTDDDVALAAADELLRRPAHVRREVLGAIATHPAAAVRMRLVAAGGADAGLGDPDPLVRATALSIASAALDDDARTRALADGDPAVREAVIAHATLPALSALLATERDPWIRRAAARRLVRADADSVVQLASDPDAHVRTLAIPHLDPARPDHLAALVSLTADPAFEVQSAIVEALAAIDDDVLRGAPATTPAAATAIEAWLEAGHAHPAMVTAVREPRRVEPIAPAVVTAATVPRRAFGASGVTTTPLVISGAFDLQPGSLRFAAEHGITTYFWEPAYAGLTRFLRGRRERARSQVVTGTYHADARSIEKDVDRALARLRRDVIDVYLLFWSRSDARLDEDAFAVMDALRRAGKVRAIGFSTHDRQLAMRALDRAPWDVVMTRHSAAHPGIEDGMLAHATARNAGVLTFTALCYGRMLQGEAAPSAQDCYRYSLAQDGVTATISAPRRHRELVENLEVLGAGAMTEAELARVRAHGAAVRIESQRFNALVRQPTRDAAAAAMAMLEDALAPQGDRDEACVTPEALRRSLGSRGRGRASLPSAMLRRGRL